MVHAERYWPTVAQHSSFAKEILSLRQKRDLSKKGSLLPLHPVLDTHGLLRIGGRANRSNLPYSSQHPVVLPGDHTVTELIVHTEHLCLLHAGPTFVATSLSCHFHIVRPRSYSIAHSGMCHLSPSHSQPSASNAWTTSTRSADPWFRVEVDYAGPVTIKSGSVHKPTFVKDYVCIFVSLSTKAVHLELVSDLASEANIATLRHFIAHRGKPSCIRSDNGANFVGAVREIKELFEFLGNLRTQRIISDFCSSQHIHIIAERAPHFGSHWEAAVKSIKTHLKIIADTKLTFEEFTTVLIQVKVCLNSRPLTPLSDSDHGLEALTPGNFIIGRPLEALPDSSLAYRPHSLLRRWHLCQALVRHFRQRWSSEYLCHVMKFTQWNFPTRNLQVGDLVCLREDGLVPAKWSLVHPGRDGLVRMATVRTTKGT